MNNTPFVSIIVLNFNGKEYLEGCFASLEKLDYPRDRFEVIMKENERKLKKTVPFPKVPG